MPAQGKGQGGNKGNGKSRAEHSDNGGGRQKADRPERAGNQRQDIKAERKARKSEHSQIRDHRERPQNIPGNKEPRQRQVTPVWAGRGERLANDRYEQRPQKKRNGKDHRSYAEKDIDRNDGPQYRDRDERQKHPRFLGPPIRQNAWTNDYRYDRRYDARWEKAERKALKNQRKALKKWAKNSDRYYASHDDWQIPDRRYRGDTWRNVFLRSVVVNVIGDGAQDYFRPQYYNYGYGIPYSADYGRYDYEPYPSYQRTAATTAYYGRRPYAYESDYGQETLYPSEFAGDLGLPYLADTSVGGFISSLFGNLVALGYNQGYLDAQNARSGGYSDAYYTDPYDPYVYVEDNYEDIGYDPYSCFAENQRYLSEGYELGYRDAQYGENQLAEYDTSGIDLVSLLIGSVL